MFNYDDKAIPKIEKCRKLTVQISQYPSTALLECCIGTRSLAPLCVRLKNVEESFNILTSCKNIKVCMCT